MLTHEQSLPSAGKNNTQRAVEMLESLIQCGVKEEKETSDVKPASGKISLNIKSSQVSPVEILNDIIGEMEAVLCHTGTSLECIGESSTPPRPPQQRLRRGASRDNSDAITGELRRPQEECDNRKQRDSRRESRLRREASSDLSATITGQLRRPDDAAPPQREHRGSNLRREASSDLSSTITGELRRPDDVAPRQREHRGSHLRREASSDLSSTITGELRRPDDDSADINDFRKVHIIGKQDSIAEEVVSSKYTDESITINMLDIRVGKVLSVEKHKSADLLYCQYIDVGEEKPRPIASGLVPYYTANDLEERSVVVVCNLKPRNMKGFSSDGMVLCASKGAGDDRVVELLCPPSSAKPGDRIFAPSIPGNIVTPQKCDKKKILAAVSDSLRVDDVGRFIWDNLLLTVGGQSEGDFCYAPTLRCSEVG